MNIRFSQGDMFASKAEAIVNTVNCVGVMGKGVALEFKTRWPDNFKAYKRACADKSLRPGRIFVFQNSDLLGRSSPRYLINFPTKDHWRNKSKLSYIEDGLDALVKEVERLGISSIAMPPLGCGNGGLNWEDVRPIIDRKLAVLKGVEVEVFEPSSRTSNPEYVDIASKMTSGRALLLRAILPFEAHMGGSVDRLSLQKIAYFLQELGTPLKLDFRSSLYGPHSYVLSRALRRMDQWRYIEGLQAEGRRVRVTPVGLAAADEFFGETGSDESVVEKLLHLTQGYENPYGLELLSTIHYHSKNRAGPRGGQKSIIESLTEGPLRRRNNFDVVEVEQGFQRLVEDGLIGPKSA